MYQVDIEELRSYAWVLLVEEGRKGGRLTQRDALFLYDVMVVLKQVQDVNMEIILEDTSQRDAYAKGLE